MSSTVVSIGSVILILVVVYYVYTKFFPAGKNEISESESDSDSDSDFGPDSDGEMKELSLKELHRFNGKDNPEKKIYVSINGIIFDVTKGKFYQDGGDYAMFSGHEISVNLAKHQTDKKFLDILDLGVLSKVEKMELQNTIMYYEGKYERVGTLKEWKTNVPPKSEASKKSD